jgi:hypothetical protein
MDLSGPENPTKSRLSASASGQRLRKARFLWLIIRLAAYFRVYCEPPNEGVAAQRKLFRVAF